MPVNVPKAHSSSKTSPWHGGSWCPFQPPAPATELGALRSPFRQLTDPRPAIGPSDAQHLIAAELADVLAIHHVPFGLFRTRLRAAPEEAETDERHQSKDHGGRHGPYRNASQGARWKSRRARHGAQARARSIWI